MLTEAQEQVALFKWIEIQSIRHPELALCHAIPNGGSRNKIEAVHLKMQGVKQGIPDICLPVPRGAYHGLYIELKRRKGGRLSKAQMEMIIALRDQGYCAEVCQGCDEAAELIKHYLGI